MTGSKTHTLSRREFMKIGGGLLAAGALGATFGKSGLQKRPNIILILADDLGFSDLGCYGGEIETPNLDRLAKNGLRFTEFYNSARCCPSRASIMTGLYPHQAGIGNMTGDQGLPGYRGRLADNCAIVPEVLRAAGYRTYVSGKWHLNAPGPMARGVDEYYGFKNFAAHSVDCWTESEFVRLPEGRPQRTYGAGKFYATDAIADHALDFIADARAEKKPFFLYLAFNAPHFPLQAPKELIDKYQKVYERGWDTIREERYARMKKLGIIDGSWPLSPRSTIPPNRVADPQGWTGKQNPAWETLDADRRTDLARRMAIFAAMVDRMDQGIGRVTADLEKAGELDNTLIFFLSDNGACAEWVPYGFDGSSGPNNVLHKGAELEKMGQPGSYHSYGSAWAGACNTPLRLYKHFAHEGGISTPLIVHWPAGTARKGEIDGRPGHISDLMATCVEAAGAQYPKTLGGREILLLEGQSLLPALKGEPAKERTIYFEHEGNRAVREGKWKLVALRGQAWELYDEDADRVELNDLAPQNPERVKKMAALWEEWARRCLVTPGPALPGTIPAPTPAPTAATGDKGKKKGKKKEKR